jgi:putative tricarboxylic transport membrane protein
MTRLYQIVGALFLALGAFVIYLSLDLSYSADYGPGPGFFSFWLGVLLIVLALIDIIGVSRAAREPLPEGFIPGRDGVKRILLIMASLMGALFLLQPLGFPVTILLFNIVLLRSMGRQSWWATGLISLVGSFGTFYLFQLLQVALPTGFLGF